MKRFIIIALVAMGALLGSCNSVESEPCKSGKKVEGTNITAYEFTYEGKSYIVFEDGLYRFAVVEKH